MGIAMSSGVIRDFAGPYYVSVSDTFVICALSLERMLQWWPYQSIHHLQILSYRYQCTDIEITTTKQQEFLTMSYTVIFAWKEDDMAFGRPTK